MDDDDNNSEEASAFDKGIMDAANECSEVDAAKSDEDNENKIGEPMIVAESLNTPEEENPPEEQILETIEGACTMNETMTIEMSGIVNFLEPSTSAEFSVERTTAKESEASAGQFASIPEPEIETSVPRQSTLTADDDDTSKTSLTNGLARMADFLQEEDQRMLRIHGFGPIHIPCERLEIALQRDQKDLERIKIREKRERRNKEMEERRKKRKEMARDEFGDSGVEKDEMQHGKRRKKYSKHKGRFLSGPSCSSVRDEAVTPQQKHSYASRIVQCCVCDLIVNRARFDGRETAYCSHECITKKVEEAKKCVKEGEFILLMDLKGNMKNGPHNPTVETLESVLLGNPSFQPVISTQMEEEAAQRQVDPAQQRKIESMRMDVRKAIEAALHKRSKSANMIFSMKRYKDLGYDIERALFSDNQQDVNLKYRKWFKGFITVINDENNGFFRDVMRDKVSVKKLVIMPPEQMHVPIIAKTMGDIATTSSASIVAAADSTSTSDAPIKDKAGPSVDAAKEEITSIASKLITTSRHGTMVKKQPLSKAHGKSALDDILGNMNSDTTHLHHSHLYDANCGICKKNNLQKFAEKERLEKLEAKMEAKRKAEEAKSGNFPNLDPSIRAALEPDDAGMVDMLARAKRRKQEEEAEMEERRLRDPLGLESVQAMPPDRLPIAGGISPDLEDNDAMDFSAGDDGAFDDFDANTFQPQPAEHPNDMARREILKSLEDPMDTNNDNGNQNMLDDGKMNKEPFFLRSDFDDSFGADGFCGDSQIFTDPIRTPTPQERRENPIDVMESRFPTDGRALSHASPHAFDESSFHFHQSKHGPTTPGSDFSQPQASSRMSNRGALEGESWKREVAQQTAGTQMPNPWNIHSHKVWSGTFSWSRELTFECSLRAVSNRGAFKAGHELPPILNVLGKSDSAGVWSYIAQLKDSWNKQVILMVVEPPTDQSEFGVYMNCFEKINNNLNQQIVVLDLKNHQQIKDGYLFSLNPSERLPKILFPLEGPGLPLFCKHQGCVVLMLIRRMDREDKLFRKHQDQQDETWRPPLNTQTNDIPLDMAPDSELQKQPLILRDPRLDELLTKYSKIYRPQRLIRKMPGLLVEFLAKNPILDPVDENLLVENGKPAQINNSSIT